MGTGQTQEFATRGRVFGLFAVFNPFLLEISTAATKMTSFNGLAKSCLKNPCTNKLVERQLEQTRGERPELRDSMKIGQLNVFIDITLDLHIWAAAPIGDKVQ